MCVTYGTKVRVGCACWVRMMVFITGQGTAADRGPRFAADAAADAAGGDDAPAAAEVEEDECLECFFFFLSFLAPWRRMVRNVHGSSRPMPPSLRSVDRRSRDALMVGGRASCIACAGAKRGRYAREGEKERERERGMQKAVDV